MLTLASFTTFTVWILWSLLYPYALLQTKPGSWTVKNPGKLVPRGTQVLLAVDYCASFATPPVLLPRLEQEGRLIPLSPREFPGPAEGCHLLNIPIGVPRALPLESTSAGGSGQARLYITVQYKPNPLRDLYFDFVTDVFTITP